MGDLETVVRVTRAALEALADRLDTPQDEDGHLPDDASLVQMMFEASQGLLGREAPTSEEVAERLQAVAHDRDCAEELAKGHAGDAAIADDRDAFLDDLGALPPPWQEPLQASNTSNPAELTGVCLHFLVESEPSGRDSAVRTSLSRLLGEAGQAEGEVVLQYLRPVEGEDDAAFQTRYTTVIEFLRTERLARMLRRCGALDLEAIERGFPRDFGLYLDSLDPDRSDEIRELEDLAGRLGPARIHEATRALADHEHLTDPQRATRLLASSAPAMLPFLRILLTHGSDDDRRQVVAWLRRVRGKEAAACLLYVVDQPDLLPLRYLLALTEAVPGAKASQTLRNEIATVLCRYLRGTHGQPEKVSRRIYAVQHLARYMIPEARTLLEEMLRARRFLVVPIEPRPLRQAVRQALRAGHAL